MATYTRRVELNYTPAQLFDLVVDVERYPEFIPWVIAIRLRRRAGDKMWTDFTVGVGPLCKRFSTVAVLERPHRVAISSHDSMFERFEQRWVFESLTKTTTRAEYRVDFRFKSFLLQALMDLSFPERADAIVAAYVRRARHLYGAP